MTKLEKMEQLIAELTVNIFDHNNPWDAFCEHYPNTEYTASDMCAIFDKWQQSYLGMENMVRHDVRTLGRVYARTKIQKWADICPMSGYQYKWALQDLFAYAPEPPTKEEVAKQTFGQWLQTKLDAQGMSQTAFGHHLQVTRATVSLWINDKSLPNVQTFVSIGEWVAHWESKELGAVLVEMGGTL